LSLTFRSLEPLRYDKFGLWRYRVRDCRIVCDEPSTRPNATPLACVCELIHTRKPPMRLWLFVGASAPQRRKLWHWTQNKCCRAFSRLGTRFPRKSASNHTDFKGARLEMDSDHSCFQQLICGPMRHMSYFHL
jgi:hypothetical protein